jgi:hypothetical protein
MVGKKVGRRVGKIWRYQKIVGKWWGNNGGKNNYQYIIKGQLAGKNWREKRREKIAGKNGR